MPSSEESFKEKAACERIVQICQRLHKRNMLAAADGNVSVRLDANLILITPSGVAKAFISPSQMAAIDLRGNIIRGTPSSEMSMHLEVYRQRPEAQCVVHAHPPTAIAWSIAHPTLTELPSDCLSEIILAVGRIPIVPYARPGSPEMGTALLPELQSAQRVMILSRHGALSWGETMEEAYGGMERIEHSAQILKLAHELGGITPLPSKEVKILREMRLKMGGRSL